MTYEEMKAMVETHACAECGMPLVTIWDKDKNDYKLVCGTDRSHKGYQLRLSPSQELARGTMDKVTGKGSQESLEDMAKRGVGKVSLMVRNDLATNKALDNSQIQSLIVWGVDTGLKPWLGHVCLYFGKPYVTVDGYYYLNNKRDKPYSISTRPMTTEEKKANQLTKDDHAWLAEAKDKEGVVVATGVGIATKDELDKKSEKNPEHFRSPVAHDHPQRMAEKRAEWQVLHKVIALEVKE
jgi:hypothetical protein